MTAPDVIWIRNGVFYTKKPTLPATKYRREQECVWILSTDGLAEYSTPHGDRVPSSRVQGMRGYTNCPYCGGKIKVVDG